MLDNKKKTLNQLASFLISWWHCSALMHLNLGGLLVSFTKLNFAKLDEFSEGGRIMNMI